MAEPLPSPAEDLELLRASAVAAGIIAAGYFRRELRTWTKEHDSPVSEADIMLDRFLHGALLAARPGYGWLSEESADSPARLTQRRVFVVDPIDGTRGFIRGEDTWTVCLAVVEDGVATAGVVYAPARDEMYAASRGGGARLNGKPIVRTPTVGDSGGLLIPAPGAVHRELKAAGVAYEHGPAYPSLAYRLVKVATGRLGAAVARRGSADWDLAAAAVVLSEAGIDFEDVCAGPVRFNAAEVRHGALAAVGAPWLKPALHEALIKVYGCPAETTDRERSSS
jgi:myo-inositol-1(or 4)-monophosphatase